MRVHLKLDGFRETGMGSWAKRRVDYPADVPLLKDGERACTEVYFLCETVSATSSMWTVRVFPNDNPDDTWRKGIEFTQVLDKAFAHIVDVAPVTDHLMIRVLFYRAIGASHAAAAEGPDHVVVTVDTSFAKEAQRLVVEEQETRRQEVARENERLAAKIDRERQELTTLHGDHEEWLLQHWWVTRMLSVGWWWCTAYFSDAFQRYVEQCEAYDKVEDGKLPTFRPQAIPFAFAIRPIAWDDESVVATAASRGEKSLVAFMRSMHSLQWGNNPLRRKMLDDAGAGHVIGTMLASAVDEHPGAHIPVMKPHGGERRVWKPGDK